MTNSVSILEEPIFNGDGIVNDTQITAVTYLPDDRNDEVDSNVWMNRLAWPMMIGMIVLALSTLSPSAYPSSVIKSAVLMLMGMWIVWLLINITPCSKNLPVMMIDTKWITLIMLSMFVLLSLTSGTITWILLTALTIGVTCEQIARLAWTLLKCPRSETKLQKRFYGALTFVYVVATLASLALLVKVVVVTQSTSSFYTVESSIFFVSSSSFYTALSSVFFFAYASNVASIIMGTRGTCAVPNITFSCRNVSWTGFLDLDACCTATLAILLHIIVIVPFVLLWPPTNSSLSFYSEYTDQEITNQVVVLGSYTSVLAIQALVYKMELLRAREFHVRSDGSILVETLSKTYIYDNVVAAKVEPWGVIPKQTESCHVYASKKDTPFVLIQQSGGRWLCLTPELPGKLTNAVTRAIKRSSA
jgi:hypothetical protein